MKSNDIQVAIVSGGIDALLSECIPDAHELFNYIFINRLMFDGFGSLCGVVSTQFDFDGKLKAVEKICHDHGWSLDEAVFVGDDFNDQHVINSVGLSIAYVTHETVLHQSARHVVKDDDLLSIVPLILGE